MGYNVKKLNMQKYIKEIINAINSEQGVAYLGEGNEAATHFVFDENDDSLIHIRCYGISFPDKGDGSRNW